MKEEYRRAQEDLEELSTLILWRRYRQRISSYVGPNLRKVRVVDLQEILDELERFISDDELNELCFLDLLVRGQVRELADRPEVWLALEISHIVDQHTVERAQRRAAILQKGGYRAIPVVAGTELTEGAETALTNGIVFTIRKGERRYWDDALANALN